MLKSGQNGKNGKNIFTLFFNASDESDLDAAEGMLKLVERLCPNCPVYFVGLYDNKHRSFKQDDIQQRIQLLSKGKVLLFADAMSPPTLVSLTCRLQVAGLLEIACTF